MRNNRDVEQSKNEHLLITKIYIRIRYVNTKNKGLSVDYLSTQSFSVDPSAAP